MSKTFDTKKNILGLLKKRPMTVTEISEALGLSKPTVSQHMSELERMNVVNRIDNSHYRKVQYFRIVPKLPESTNSANIDEIYKILIPAIVAIAVIASVLMYASYSSIYKPVTPKLQTTSVACPMLRIYNAQNPINSSEALSVLEGIANGSPCYLSYVNTSTHMIANIGYNVENSTVIIPELGVRYALNATQVSGLESMVDQGDCAAVKSLSVFGINYSIPAGVTCNANIYS